ncbi:DCD and Cell domain protein [Perilla frutescens var. frutescens]|nr:DCD and Cell domain protein [Perilla frutescens var. frutescens]
MDDNGENINPVERMVEATPMRPPEFLPRTEILGGYIFVCNNDTMQESMRRQIFGLPDRYRDSVRAIRPGLPLFLYNYQTGQLHGVFEATSFGGMDIDPSAWPDNNNPGKSRFPAQIRTRRRKICPPMEDTTFRPLVEHYTGNRFRIEVTVPEVINILDIFNGSIL